MTPDQLREARRLLSWSLAEVAAASDTYTHVVYKYETRGPLIRERAIAERMEQVRAIQAALEAAGVEFIQENGSGPGVRLRKGAE